VPPGPAGRTEAVAVAMTIAGTVWIMDALRWDSRPQLHEPTMIAAFEGWTDAGGAATGAASYLSARWSAREFADIDAEEFYDFTVRRPQVRLRSDWSREIVWPRNRFLTAAVPDGGDVIIMIGTEPHVRWRAFCDCVTSVASELQVGAFFTLGSTLADVAHTRPTPVRVSTADVALSQRLGLQRPQYQGPTGIVGVLQDAFANVAVPAGSVMAQVPHYVSGTPSPKATLALVEEMCSLLDTEVATEDLEQAVATYLGQVDEAVGADPDITEYVEELERRTDAADRSDQIEDLPSGDVLAAQLEQFLREQGDSR
jgi:proteasome assembly chaperone (PAC2) family protein